MWPKLVLNLAKLKHNTEVIAGMVGQAGGTVFGVTKVVGGDPRCARAMLAGGASGIADSRLENIRRLRGAGIDAPILLLRSPALSEVGEVVRLADFSLVSDRTVLKALDREAALAGVVHRIIIMTDLGEGREGVAPQDLPDLAAFARGLINLKLVGIGTNFACLNKAWPSVAKLKALVGLYQKVDDGSMAYLSGSNSSSLHLLLNGQWRPPLLAINHWRVGESIFLGWDLVTKSPLPGCYQDVCRLELEVIEVRREVVRMRPAARILLAGGTEEIGCGRVSPVDPAIKITGVSSDHLVAFIEGEHTIEVGSSLAFSLDYQALLAAANSTYVKVEYKDRLS
ncbi:MAG TPA: alanine racemase [Limnochordia bacterium]|nr:alanine racemase [Limnochordia bacterium]